MQSVPVSYPRTHQEESFEAWENEQLAKRPAALKVGRSDT
jgi:hypothetical protein